MRIQFSWGATRFVTLVGIVTIKVPRFSALLTGIRANRNEYRLWQEFPRRFLIPTLYSFGWLINIQERGESINQEELDASHPFQGLLEDMPSNLIADMTRATNFCRYQGRICLADYGSDEVLAFFLLPQPQSVILAIMAQD